MDYKIARRITTARTNIGLTQKELAEKIGVDKSQITRLESGNVNGVTIGRISAIADVLGVNPVWLSGFDNEQDSKVVDVSLLTDDEIKQVEKYIQFIISSRE